MISCDAASEAPAPGPGGRRRGVALALWLSIALPSQNALADHVFGVDQPHFHDYSGTASVDRKLRESPQGRRILELQAQLEAQPGAASIAAELAGTYLTLFRYEGDPGLIVRTKDVLAAWADEVDPPAQLALARAVLWQTEHRFAAAFDELERLVRREPRNVRAWLTLASVAKELRLYPDALNACGQLLWLSDAVLGGACLASVWTDTGRAPEAYAVLERELGAGRDDLDVEVLVWLHSLAAEAAIARDRPDLAEPHYIEGLAVAATAGRAPEVYLFVEYADFLVAENRPRDALELLHHAPRALSITLREADAQRHPMLFDDAQGDQQERQRDCGGRGKADHQEDHH